MISSFIKLKTSLKCDECLTTLGSLPWIIEPDEARDRGARWRRSSFDLLDAVEWSQLAAGLDERRESRLTGETDGCRRAYDHLIRVVGIAIFNVEIKASRSVGVELVIASLQCACDLIVE